MKKIILSIVMLLFMSMSVFAYGGGGAGMVVPTAIYAKYLSIDEPKVLWTPPYIKDGMMKKIDKDGIALKSVLFHVDKTNYGKYFLVVSKNDVKENEYASWHIDSDVGKIKSVELEFVIDKEWVKANPEWELTKDGEKIEVTPNGQEGNFFKYKTTVTSFSDFVIYGLPEEQEQIPSEQVLVDPVNIPVETKQEPPIQVIETEPYVAPKKASAMNILIVAGILLAVVLVGYTVHKNRKEDKEEKKE